MNTVYFLKKHPIKALLLLLLVLFASQSCKVCPSQSGVVVDEQGQPISGAYLSYVDEHYSALGLAHPVSVVHAGKMLRTDEAGRFEVPSRWIYWIPFIYWPSDETTLRIRGAYAFDKHAGFGQAYYRPLPKDQHPNPVLLVDGKIVITLAHSEFLGDRLSRLREFQGSLREDLSNGNLKLSPSEQEHLFALIQQEQITISEK